MKHEEFKPILDRDLAVVLNQENKNLYESYFREVINCAASNFVRCQGSLRGVSGTPSALIALYYHSIQLADGIEVLTGQSCYLAAEPLYRGLHEALLSIRFMLKENYDTRSSAWMVERLLEEREGLNKYDLRTERGREFKRKLEKDRSIAAGDLKFPDPRLIDQGLANVKRLLEKEKFASLVDKFYPADKKGKKTKQKLRWYSIADGPKNIKELAKQVESPVEYEIYYKRMSQTVHGSNALRMLGSSDKTGFIVPIREQNDWGTMVLRMSSFFLVDIGSRISDKIRPEENFRETMKEIVNRHKIKQLDDF